MSANFGRRLYASLWESAHPFLGRIRPNRVPSPRTSSRNAFDPIFASNRRLSSAPGKSTQLTRRFASGGFLVLVSPSSTAAETSAACIIPSKKLSAQYIWKRALHTPNDRLREGASSNASKSPKDDEHPQKVENTGDLPLQSSHSTSSQDSPPSTATSTSPHRHHHLVDRLPHMSHLHRPTKEELLAAATGFWSRLKVRFKWFSIRSVRPFNLDEIAALFSWVLLGHVVWVVVGTTTFFSLLILAINTVFAQGMLSGFGSVEASLSTDDCDRNTRRMGRQLSDQVIRS